VLHWPWYYPVLFGGCALVFGVLYALANSIAGLLALSLVGTLTGMVLTMIAMAWAVAIVFADDVKSGLWFVLFPPYMPLYAARRWRWMAQPSVMFLCGLALAAAASIAFQWRAKSIEAPPARVTPETSER
jgi:MFS family permease